MLKPDRVQASTAYEAPPRMREWVQLRNQLEVFPFSERSSRGLDLDHTIPYRWTMDAREAPPQTRPDNLGPLGRLAHRVKTHGGWQLSQPVAGTFLWRSPLGFGYLVTPSRTFMVEDPTGRIMARTSVPPVVALAS